MHAHQFRHTFVRQYLTDGGHRRDLLRLVSWKSRQLLAFYGTPSPKKAPWPSGAVSATGWKVRQPGRLGAWTSVGSATWCPRPASRAMEFGLRLLRRVVFAVRHGGPPHALQGIYQEPPWRRTDSGDDHVANVREAGAYAVHTTLA